jgi:hypothetical protein
MQSLAAGGILMLLALEQEPKHHRTSIHLDELTCKAFTELTRPEQTIITAWLKGNHLPEHRPPVIDFDKLLSDTAKLIEHCNTEPEDDVMTAAEALLEN